jgi:cobalt-zinc-cadmium efflux system protein
MNHDHSGSSGEAHNHFGSAASRNKGRLYIVLALTGTFLVAEVVGGLITGSLALLADAGHMLTDVLGLVMALVAIHLGERTATDSKTFGYQRTEILAALTNAVILIVVAVYVLYEAVKRFSEPPEVLGGGMLAVAVVGLLVNIASLLILRSSADESLNMRGAYLEVLGDALGSIGAIVGAVIILLTGWYLADPIIGVLIGFMIVPRAFSLLRESVNVLLEATPKHISLAEVRETLKSMENVLEVHDLHAWTITSGMYALSGHIVTANMNFCDDLLTKIQTTLHERFDISHCTIQLETPKFREQLEVHS